MCELVPGADSTEPQEDGDVEEHVNGRLQGVILGFQSKPIAAECLVGKFKKAYSFDILPREGVSSNEAGQDVVTSNHSTSANDEQLQEGDSE